MIYQVFGDEAWTHAEDPPNRYHCFLGGFLTTEVLGDRVSGELKFRLSKSAKPKAEVKWTSLSADNLDLYKDLIMIVLKHLKSKNLRYRQLFMDRRFERIPERTEPPRSDLDIQFRVYYQFLKHAFGIKHLETSPGQHQVVFRLDSHSSQRHKSNLISFGKELPKQWKRPDLDAEIRFLRSRKRLLIQMADLIIGAAGSYGNKKQLLREPGKRGMTSKQKIRLELAKFIYDGLRDVHCADRGKTTFDWFQSSGSDGQRDNMLRHAVSVWKFKPKFYCVDNGWNRSNLDKQGRYQGPKIDMNIYEVGRGLTGKMLDDW